MLAAAPQRTPALAKAEFEAGVTVALANRVQPTIVELLDIAEFTHHVESVVPVGEPIFHPYPPECHFQEYEPFEVRLFSVCASPQLDLAAGRFAARRATQ